MIAQRADNPYPVDSDNVTRGHMPAEALDRLFDATVPPIERLRQAAAEVDPALISTADATALLALIAAAAETGSEFAEFVDRDRLDVERCNAERAAAGGTLAETITRALDDLDRALAEAVSLGAPVPGLSQGDARAAAVAVDARRRFTDLIGSGD